MIRYVLLFVLLAVYAECASVSTDKPPDCGDTGVWLPCGPACQLPCWLQKQKNHPVCRPVCHPELSQGGCGCKEGYGIDPYGNCEKC